MTHDDQFHRHRQPGTRWKKRTLGERYLGLLKREVASLQIEVAMNPAAMFAAVIAAMIAAVMQTTTATAQHCSIADQIRHLVLHQNKNLLETLE